MNTLPRSQLELLHKLRKGWTLVHKKPEGYCTYERYGNPRKVVNQAARALLAKGYIANVSSEWQRPVLELTELGRTARVTLPAKAKG